MQVRIYGVSQHPLVDLVVSALPEAARGEAVELGAGCLSRLPAQEMAVGRLGAGRGVQAGKAGAGFGLVPFPGGRGGVEPEEGMMDQAGVAGVELECAHEAPRGVGEGEDEVPVDIASFGREEEGFGQGDDEVGRAQAPALGWGRGCRGRAGSLDGPLRGPAPESFDLVLPQAPIAHELPGRAGGQPGGHDARGGDLVDEHLLGVVGVFAGHALHQRIKIGRAHV